MYEQVQKYYGETLSHSDDLKTNACCTDESMPDHMKTILANIHDEVMAKYYGCGMVSPQLLKGMKILDLGSGSGKDCYALAQLVGEEGEVVGVDMTDEQLAVANKHIDSPKVMELENWDTLEVKVALIEHKLFLLDEVNTH